MLFRSIESTHYITIFNKWGHEKVDKLKNEGFNVVVLFEKPISEKKISSTLIRDLIVEGGEWETLVPKSVQKYVEELNLRERIIQLRKYK